MKTLLIITLTLLFILNIRETKAEIRNGYEQDLVASQQQLINLKYLKKKETDKKKLKVLSKWLKEANKLSNKIKHYHQLTQELLENFRAIDPDLFYEINTIEDREGNETHVYVKLVEKLKPPLLGATNFDYAYDNLNIHRSEYGEYSVSVKIAYSSYKENLKILAHELGHVRYQIPNLSSYITFYNDNYDGSVKIIGHLPNDPSHQSVMETLKSFNRSYGRFYKMNKKANRNVRNELVNPDSKPNISAL